MRVGMLWYDDKGTLEEKTRRALARYNEKYGLAPDSVHVHPSMLVEGTPEIEGVTFHASNHVLPNHLWVGINNQATAPERTDDNDNLS